MKLNPHKPKMQSQDVVLDVLKARYFELASKENIPHTPEITANADRLEAAIRKINSDNSSKTITA